MQGSVVIPTLNEYENLRVLLRSLLDSGHDLEILICDNGSTDGTWQYAENVANVRVLRGFGSVGDAVLRGLYAASYSKIVVMDGDGSHPVDVALQILGELAHHDMVVASRYEGGQSQDTNRNRMLSQVGNLVAFGLAPFIPDRMSGFWSIRREIVQRVHGARATAKPMLEFYIRGDPSSVGIVNYTFAPRISGESKIGRRSVLFRTLLDTLGLYAVKFAKPLKFLIVSTVGLGINLGALLFFTEILNVWYALSAVIGIALGLTWNFVMHSMWTFGTGSLRDLWHLGHKPEDPDFEWWEYFGPHPVKRWWKRRIADLTFHLASKATNLDRVLVVGCGSSPAINRYKAKGLVGIDINSSKIDFLANHSNALLFTRDITNSFDLPRVAPQQYDVILCNEVLEHLSALSLRDAVANMVHVLAEGGRIIVSIPDESQSRIGRIIERVLHGNIHHPITMDTIKKLMAMKGLEEVDRKKHLWVQVACFEKR